jgi:hypothetical protein
VAVYDDGTWQIRLTGSGATSTVTGFGTGSWPSSGGRSASLGREGPVDTREAGEDEAAR